MKTIKGDLILKKDTTFKESIKVEGDIKGYFDLKVIGNIDCWNIDCWDIDCWDIIYCEKLTKKCKNGVIKAKVFVDKRSELKQKEWVKNERVL